MIQNTASDLEHNEKDIVECVFVLFHHTRPPLIFSSQKKQVEKMDFVWTLW